MPHLRKRALESAIRHDITWSSVVSILGMRQSGKTTLLRQIASHYITLDNDQTLNQFEQGIWTQLEASPSPLVIDEAQKSPGLFDRIKLIVDQKPRPGQFLLTGSIRFLSRKQIRESLTGRASILELLPLCLAESHSRPMTEFIRDISTLKPGFFLKKYEKKKLFSETQAKHYLEFGGMPGVCFKRDETLRHRIRETHIETLLMRDIQFLVKTRVPYVKLKTLLSAISQTQGQSISLADLARNVQLYTPTVIQMIQAFENLFIIRPHGKTWYFSDCGMAGFLGADKNASPSFHMERFVYQELYAQLNYLHRAQFSWGPYLTRGGIRIPFVIEFRKLRGSKAQKDLAIMIDPSDGGSEKSLKSLTWYSKGRSRPCATVVLHAGSQAYLSATGAICIPYHWVS